MMAPQVVKRSGVSPDFESELIAFDIVEPREFIVEGDITLVIELWDDNAWSDDLLASVQLSALRYNTLVGYHEQIFKNMLQMGKGCS